MLIFKAKKILLFLFLITIQACVSTSSNETILIFKKEKGSNKAHIFKNSRDLIERKIEVVFPEEYKSLESTIGILETMKEDKSGYNYYLKDDLSEFKISKIEEQSSPLMIYLNRSNNKKEEYYYSSFSMKTLYISYYYGLDHICKTVYLPEKDLYITNNHCLSSEWQCFGSKIGSQDSEEFCDKVLYTEKYYDLTVFKTKGEKYKSNVVKPNLDISNSKDAFFRVFENNSKCKDFLENWNNVNVMIDESHDIKLGSYLYNCDGKIAKGFSGGPIVDAFDRLYGILWGFYTIDGADAQVIVFIPLRYINYAVEKAEKIK